MITTQVARPRLSRLLDALSDRQLVSVVADPGSGKTTALRSWAQERTQTTAWLSVHPSHGDPARLLAALVRATAAACPDLPGMLAPELAARPGLGQPTDDAVTATALADALASAWSGAEPFCLVLDDVHELLGGPGQSFLTHLVRRLPDELLLVTAGRTPLPFAVDRLRAAGRFGEITQRALRFDAAEVAALFAHVGLELDVRDAAAVAQACAGWATAVRLAVEAALAGGTAYLLEQVGGPTPAADHLAQTVLRTLEPDAYRLVRGLDVLARVPRALVISRERDTAGLDALAERGLLVTRNDAAWALTPLARFALQQTSPLDPAERERVLRGAVALARDDSLGESALQWALELGDDDVLGEVVGRFGRTLLDTCSIGPLERAAERLPVPAGAPAADALLAELFAQRGDVPRALAHLGGLPGTVPVDVAGRVAAAFWAHGQSLQVAAVLDRAADVGADADLSLADSVRATLAWSRGDGDRCRPLADRALAAATRSGDESALASAWVVQALAAVLDGDMTRNQQAYDHALRHADAAGDVLAQVRVHCNVGSRLNETGDFTAALVELAEAVRLGEASGQTTRVALARHNQGDSRLGLGQLDLALQEYDAALSIWVSVDSPMAAYSHQGRGDALARRGDTARAAAAYREAVALGERFDNAQVLVPALAGLARVEHSEDPRAADELVERALAEPAAAGSLPAYLAAGWIALARGDRDRAQHWARQTRAEAGRRQDPAALAEALALAVLAEDVARADDGRLVEAHALWTEVANPIGAAEIDLLRAVLAGDERGLTLARSRLRGLGVRDSVARIAGVLAVLGEQAPVAVEIRALGTFTVLREGRAVPASAWQSRKARDLVKILAGRRGRALTRDALADLLWPDSGPGTTANRLSVALSTARTVLDPDRAHPADRFLSADRGAVRLDTAHVALDVLDFLDRAEIALSAAPTDAVLLLEAAAAAYAGDFCEDDPYEPWADAPREELRTRHHEVLRTLAELLADSPRPATAVPWLLTMLRADPHDEPTHLQLVSTLVRTGRHGEARRSYRTYVARMAEIDVEPAPFPQRGRRHLAG